MSRVLPILFNTDMVRAILDGRKMVTRRCIKYKYSNTKMKIRTDKYGTRLIEIQKDVEGETFGKNPDGSTWHKLLGYVEPKSPYKPGDILYVRETWARFDCCSCEGDNRGKCFAEPDKDEGCYVYRATHEIYGDIRWRPSLYMPKEAARIWLRVTNVRVERLQEITNEDIPKEGVKQGKIDSYIQQMPYETDEYIRHAHTIAFQDIWESTIKKSDLERYGWNANPGVWVIEFERCEKPEEL